MRGRDIMIFLPIALALHIAAFAALPPASQDGAGDAGDHDITVQSAAQDLVALTQDWDTAPPLADPPPDQVQPNQNDTAPDAPSTLTVPTPRDVMPPLTSPAVAENAPSMPAPAPLLAQTAPEIPNLPLPDGGTAPQIAQTRDALPPQRQTDLAPVSPETAPSAPDIAPDRADVVPAAPAPAPPKVRPKPRPAAPAVSQKAKGIAKTTAPTGTQGASKTPQNAVATAGVIKQAIALWSGQLRQAINRKKFYPNGTRSTGVVEVVIVVSPTGALLSAKVAVSSGHTILDQAALSAVNRAKFPAAPKSMRDSRYTFRIPIRMQK